MKRTWIVLGLTLLVGTGVPARAQQPNAAPPRVSARLQNVRLQDALDSLFKSTKFDLVVYGDVKNTFITVEFRDVEFEEALKRLIQQAAAEQPGLTYSHQGNVYTVMVRPGSNPGGPAAQTGLAKIPVQFANVEELLKQLERIDATRELVSVNALPRDNSLLVRGTPEQVEELKRAIRLIDIPTRMLSIRIGVTGPGVGGRPLQLASMTRTLNSREAVIDEQMTSGGELARLRVQVRPLIQGDGGVLTESDWDLSLPLAGGPKGPIRLVKRLTTSARLRPGRSVTVGELDLAPYGGNGKVRLWLRADLLRESTFVDFSTEGGELFSGAQVYDGKPYVSAFWLADTLGGQLHRTPNGQFEIRPGMPKEPGRLPKGEQPAVPGPFRLTLGAHPVSERLQFAVTTVDQSRLVPDYAGDPLLPLEDLARLLDSRLVYDSADDSYRMVGGRRLSSFQFPAADARNR